MPAWSDLATGRAAGGEPLLALLARLVPVGARVLLAGPHDPALLDRLAHAEVTCLLRGEPDGTAVAARAARTLVGGATGIDGAYDVVVAAAGLAAIESAQDRPLGWTALLERLVTALRPGGLLLLGAENPFGLGRLVDPVPWYAGRDDADWAVDGILAPDRPADLDQLTDRLTAAGLHPWGSFAAYPRWRSATALLATGPLAEQRGSGLFDAVLHDACTVGERPVLQDPARLAVDALHTGLAAALAPGWLVLAHRPVTGAAGAVVAAAPDRITLPVALLCAGPPGSGVTEVYDGADGWRWRALAAPTPTPAAEPAPPFASREVAYRDPGASTGRVAEGRLLRTVLLDAVLRRDLGALRRLLTAYARWLAGQGVDDRLTGAVAVSGLDNVVVGAAGDHAVLDPGWQAIDPLATEVVLARALWRFAADLLTGGYAHPWPSTLDVAGLTVVLGGLAGRDLDRATVAIAVEVEAAVVAARRGLDDAARADLAAALRAVTPTAPPTGRESVQQLREAWLRQRAELTRLTARLAWTEQLLTHRERALRRAETKLDLLSGTLGYRMGKLAITPLRLARRGAGAAKRQVRTAVRRQQHGGEQQ
ncbi:class I SAM-dependent methyltransferase [Micromonospora sp. WMMA1923]|uniref:class I SAM-dependent methyltransferase n=1 Tax=Micromonospora sp. WMMA1923 TaxID=3404125 RepID=UPI003B95E3AA